MTRQQEHSTYILTDCNPTHDPQTPNTRSQEIITDAREKFSYSPEKEEEPPTAEIQEEQDIVECIYDRIEKTRSESKNLQDLAKNGLVFPRQWLPSPEYKAEIRHISGIQNYGLPQSAMLGGIVHGLLSGNGIGPRISVPFSSLVALYSGLEFFSRANTFETTPLVPGRSVYAEEICPVVSKLYHEKVPPGYEPEGKNLQMFKGFNDNCERRISFENQIRNDQGLAKDAPISIPHPGVPANYPQGIVYDAVLVSDWAASLFVMDPEKFNSKKFNAQKVVNDIYNKKK